MELNNMTIEELEARGAAIICEMDADGADLDALETEARSIRTEIEKRRTLEKQKADIRAQVAHGAGTIIESIPEERTNDMNEKEMRTQIEEALAETIKGRATAEQRALLTTDGGGSVLVSNIVDEYIWTDWDKSPILSRIRKVYVAGNYSVGYEASATGATIHAEDDDPPAEEELTIAYVDFVAQYFKKWIQVSDRVLALKGRAFLDYLYDEFGHQLAIALENATVAEIAASALTAQVTHDIDGDAVLAGIAALSDEATDPVAIMSKSTYADIKSIRTTTGARIEDPFEGLEVLFNNSVTGVLVGDLSGVVANFPEGEDFKFITDDLSLAEKDLVKIVGKVLADIHLVRPNGFALVQEE